jgi:GNAT superfamily N-acetyltransferase
MSLLEDIQPADLCIREIQLDDRVNGFSLGSSEFTGLKTFLKKDAVNFHLTNIVRTYVLVDSKTQPQVLGYISLMCSGLTLDVSQRPKENSRIKTYDVFPAIKLARLAIDKSLQGKGYGKVLVNTAIALVKDNIMPHVGCRFISVDAKQNAISFYQKIGFELLDAKENIDSSTPLMFLDMHNIK